MEQTINLKNIHSELIRIKNTMVTKNEINNFLETISILGNEETMNQIVKSEKDIISGRIKEINSVQDI